MRLRDVIASISLAAPLTNCCLREDIWHDRETELPAQPDAALATLIQQCAEQADCDPLCLHDWDSYAADHYGDYDLRVQDCKLTITNGKRVLSYEGLELCIAGRRPCGFRPRARVAGTPVSRSLAAQAELEAASVRAFADLHADLVAHRGPRALRRAAIAAAADEIRHARICARLAHRHGDVIGRAVTSPAPRRTLGELALDNAVEGCVRESYGAVVAAYQARAAADPAIRRAMRSIARDEAKHAELAWRLQRWLTPKLSASDRRRADRAARRARAELRAAAPVDAELARVVGLPGHPAQRFMLDAVDQLTAQ